MNRFSSQQNHKKRALYEGPYLMASPRYGGAVSFLKSHRSAAGAAAIIVPDEYSGSYPGKPVLHPF